MKYQKRKKALILLADGTIFYGKSVGGKEGTAFGEACFNTGMTGYQEIFTDPSYFGQLMVATTPHIGNYGVHESEAESTSVKIAGLITKGFSEYQTRPSASKTLFDYFKSENKEWLPEDKDLLKKKPILTEIKFAISIPKLTAMPWGTA